MHLRASNECLPDRRQHSNGERCTWEERLYFFGQCTYVQYFAFGNTCGARRNRSSQLCSYEDGTVRIDTNGGAIASHASCVALPGMSRTRQSLADYLRDVSFITSLLT